MIEKAAIKSSPRRMPDESLEKAAECLRTLAHPHRLRMVELLLAKRHTVAELADACGIASPVASGHLRLMQRCGLLRQERSGRNIFYRSAQPCLLEFISCIQRHFNE
jgi:DNA-binding transcriptional ArsR family regulator